VKTESCEVTFELIFDVVEQLFYRFQSTGVDDEFSLNIQLWYGVGEGHVFREIRRDGTFSMMLFLCTCVVGNLDQTVSLKTTSRLCQSQLCSK